MKIAYVLRHPGIARRTPQGCEALVIAARADGNYPPEDLRQLADADVLVVGLEPVRAALLAAAPRLKLVQRLGVGYDNIDLAAAARCGVPVCNMPDFNAATVAEHTIMLILALLRRVFESTLLMKATHWPLATLVAHGVFDFRGKTLGLIGLGAIGREVARRAAAFDVDILYYDRRRLPAADETRLGVTFSALTELLPRSDVVSCHVPGTPETSSLIGRDALRRMKRTAILINTARGTVVDEDALVEALQQATIAGAGLDVFAHEPLDPLHPLRRCPNVILTPHSAGQTREAMERMAVLLLENIERLRRSQEPRHRVGGSA
jgi:phosphoglycerate dehydrogenase-like enzyme